MYGVLRATCGSNPLGVDGENDFPNALSATRTSEWKQGTYKGHQHELMCITIQLLMSDITPLNHMQKDQFNLGGNDRQTSPNAMKLNKMIPNDYVMKLKTHIIHK